LYRGFESHSLRHTVWTAEKFLDIAPKIARNRRDSVIHTFKPDQRNRRAKCNKAALQHFSLEARNSVRFLRGPQANARRSQIDYSAKRTCSPFSKEAQAVIRIPLLRACETRRLVESEKYSSRFRRSVVHEAENTNRERPPLAYSNCEATTFQSAAMPDFFSDAARHSASCLSRFLAFWVM
jgi:hypothetical protein